MNTIAEQVYRRIVEELERQAEDESVLYAFYERPAGSKEWRADGTLDLVKLSERVAELVEDFIRGSHTDSMGR